MKDWVAAGSPACTPEDPTPPDTETSPNQIPQDELFACKPGDQGSSPSRLRRIGRSEWAFAMPNEGVGDYWAGFNPLDANSADRFSTYSSDETLDDAVLDFYLDPTLNGGRAGAELAALVAGRGKDSVLACMVLDDHPTDACIDGFAGRFLQRFVSYRPATDAERTHLATFATTILAKEASKADRPHTLARIAGAAWLTSGYR